MEAKDSEVQRLRNEVKELKTQFAELSKRATSGSTEEVEPSQTVTSVSVGPSPTPEVTALRKQVKRLQHKVEVWGLSESSYPYLGYIVIDVQFPKEFMKIQETMTVLALVCPGPKSPDRTPIIIGTNAHFFKRLAELSRDKCRTDISSGVGEQLYCTEVKALNEVVGQVKWMGPGSLIIPPTCIRCVSGEVIFHQPSLTDVLILEPPTEPLPHGILIQPVVIPASAVDVSRFSMVMQNESMKEVDIPVGNVLGQLYVTDSVMVPNNPDAPRDIHPKLIQFGDSPVPEEWKERLREKLSKRAQVFSLND
ncbi:hypothetical protein MHYP_G00177060 [Metynnis hypsauchen]